MVIPSIPINGHKGRQGAVAPKAHPHGWCSEPDTGFLTTSQEVVYLITTHKGGSNVAFLFTVSSEANTKTYR